MASKHSFGSRLLRAKKGRSIAHNEKGEEEMAVQRLKMNGVLTKGEFSRIFELAITN
jgi:hypothetical protein